MSDKMREEFEAGWGFTNEEQECYFIPELNSYGSERVNRAAEGKSTAWAYFQKGWQASRKALVVELPQSLMPVDADHHSDLPLMYAGAVIAAIEAAGVKVKP